MLNRIVRASRDFARRTETQSTAWVVFARDTASGFMTTAHHTFMILGVTAIGALTLMFVRPDITDHLKALSPFTIANAQESSSLPGFNDGTGTAEPNDIIEARRFGVPANRFGGASTGTIAFASGNPSVAPSATQHQQALVTQWLAKKYRVAGDATDMLVSAAYVTAKEIKLDPLLILSVMAIESGFNPFAESPVGAQGLMQVMSKVHHEKFRQLGGLKAALNPVANIQVGSLILKNYVTQGGSVEAGLKLYVGAAAFDTDFGYGSRVLAEYRRLKDVATGRQVPLTGPAYTAKARVVERPAQAPAAPVSEDAAAAPGQTLTNPADKVAAL
ncbi:MAG: lytic transglycosylase domain-containing protein [Herminiimonas sp.]|nr:lytic transglycosylase domain-containing protein [Herminiimonas sp.]